MRLPVLFDGGCPMCRRTVRIVRALDWSDRLQFVDATNAVARAFFAPSLTEELVMLDIYVVDERQRGRTKDAHADGGRETADGRRRTGDGGGWMTKVVPNPPEHRSRAP